MAARVSAPFAPPLARAHSPTHNSLLADLLRERAAIEPLRRSVPHLWQLLDLEITRLGALASDAVALYATTGATSANHQVPSTDSHHPASAPAPAAPPVMRKRVKLPVPADKFPEYNFVGRLLGPRGTTLKTLERDTGCKIMIRGKGSIRKDKEPDVRGKPGWEHVFNEALHVVIEVGDALDDAAASLALQRAREAVEVLLVPVPEERDSLKRQQLRALAIMNGTYRGGNPARSMDSALSSLAAFASSPPQQMQGRCVGLDHHNVPVFLGDPATMYPPPMSSFDQMPMDDHVLMRTPEYPRYDHAPDPRKNLHVPKPSGRRSPSSGATSPKGRGYDAGVVASDIADLSVKMQQCGVDEFASSSVGDDSPESSRNSDDGEPSAHVVGASLYANAKAKGLPHGHGHGHRADVTVGFGGLLGQEFYNGAFSNGPSPNPWEQPTVVSESPQFSSGLYGFSPIPSPQVLTHATSSTVTPTERHDGY